MVLSSLSLLCVNSIFVRFVQHSRLVYTIAAEYARGDRVKNMCKSWRLLFDWYGVVCVLIPQIFYIRREMPKEDYRLRISTQMSRFEQSDKNCNAQTLSSPTSSAISIFAPSTVPTSNPPLRQNFMLDVPDASVPAVEMCCEMSEAGIRISARETE